MLKPGALQRRIVGELISRMEQKGLKIISMKMMKASRELLQEHYAEHNGKPFFEDLVSYVSSSPVLAMVVAGDDAIPLLRLLCGATKVDQAVPGTIRGDFAAATTKNIIHASDSPDSAEREISLWFAKDEILEWDDPNKEWFV
jgi:nucleoside-diphosphate kinase